MKTEGKALFNVLFHLYRDQVTNRYKQECRKKYSNQWQKEAIDKSPPAKDK